MSGSPQANQAALLEIWAACAQQSLEDATQAAYTSEVLQPGEVNSESVLHTAEGTELVSLFSFDGGRPAKLTFTVSPDARLQIVQLLSGEPLDSAAAFSSSHETLWQDWLHSLGEQWTREAEPELGERLGLVSVTTAEAPQQDATQGAWRLRSGASTVTFRAALSQEQEAARVSFHSPGEVESPVHVHGAAAKTSVSRSPSEDGNVELLLDIELFATLRFGTREMQLREVLELCSGDVIPLDRAVHAPVELVVGDRIVACGDVVVVDGNYGLRVSEIATPRQRLEGIRCLF